jgi:hypothetical protein
VIVGAALGLSGACHVRDRVVGRVPLHLGQSLRSATVLDGRVVLTLMERSEWWWQIV